MTGPDLWVTLQAPGATTRLLSTITEHGLVFIDGFHDPVQLLHLTGTFATVVHHRDSAADGITTIVDLRTSPRSGRAAFTSHGLVPHTDGTGVSNPPALLLMACAHPAGTGGHSLLVDGRAVHDDLARTAPEALNAFYTPGPRCSAAPPGSLAQSSAPPVTDESGSGCGSTGWPDSPLRQHDTSLPCAAPSTGTLWRCGYALGRATRSTTTAGCTAAEPSPGRE